MPRWSSSSTDLSDYVTGAVIPIDGGFVRIAVCAVPSDPLRRVQNQSRIEAKIVVEWATKGAEILESVTKTVKGVFSR